MHVALADAVTDDDQEIGAGGEAVVADEQVADAATGDDHDGDCVCVNVAAGDLGVAVGAGGVAAGGNGEGTLGLTSSLVCCGLLDCPLDCPSGHADLLSHSDWHEMVHEKLLQKVQQLEGNLVGPYGRNTTEVSPASAAEGQIAWVPCEDRLHPLADLAKLQVVRAQQVSESYLAKKQRMRCGLCKQPAC